MHVFTIPCREKSYLLCFTLLLLQRHDSSLPYVHLWLPEQRYSPRELRKVCSLTTFFNLFFLTTLDSFFCRFFPALLLTFFSPSLLSPCSPSSPYLESVVAGSTSNNPYSPLVQCTNHMCPIRVHWHVKLNYVSYWRIKLTVLNFNYKMNYSQWNLVAQHPNFDNVTQVFSFNYKSLTPYGDAISKSDLQL